MQITKDTIVTFHYHLKDAQGELLESSYDANPITYLHGHGSLIPGLEKGLEGKEAGSPFSVLVTPQEGYGDRTETVIQRVPIKHLHGADKFKSRLRPGMTVAIETEQGSRHATVVKVGKFNVDVDTNHPLAGKTLTFEVGVQSIREASAEEIAHGHVHEAGCDHH